VQDVVIEAVHPVILAYVPRRSRLPRHTLVQAATPVAIPRVDPKGVGPRLDLSSGLDTYAFHHIDGRPFLRVDEPRQGRDVATLLRAFSRRGEARRAGLFDRAIAGSPLSAALGLFDGNGRPSGRDGHDVRGQAAEGLGGHEVAHDGTEACRGALRDWVARNLRLAGEGLYVDTGGPVLQAGRPGGADGFRALPFPRLARWPSGCFTPDEARDYRRRFVLSHHGPEAASDPDLLDIGDHPIPWAADVARPTDTLFLAQAARLLQDRLATVLRTRPGAAQLAFDGVALHPIVLRGALGMIGEDAVAGVAAQLDRVALAALAIPALAHAHGEDLNLMRIHLGNWILPRLRERAERLVEEDAAALGALSLSVPRG